MSNVEYLCEHFALLWFCLLIMFSPFKQNTQFKILLDSYFQVDTHECVQINKKIYLWCEWRCKKTKHFTSYSIRKWQTHFYGNFNSVKKEEECNKIKDAKQMHSSKLILKWLLNKDNPSLNTAVLAISLLLQIRNSRGSIIIPGGTGRGYVVLYAGHSF